MCSLRLSSHQHAYRNLLNTSGVYAHLLQLIWPGKNHVIQTGRQQTFNSSEVCFNNEAERSNQTNKQVKILSCEATRGASLQIGCRRASLRNRALENLTHSDEAFEHRRSQSKRLYLLHNRERIRLVDPWTKVFSFKRQNKMFGRVEDL